MILASQSPRRAKLLAEMGVAFSVFVPEVDERALTHGVRIENQALVLAQRKAEAACSALRHEAEGHLVLAADTVVIAEGERLDKPRSADEARAILRRLSGAEHVVLTGVALLGIGVEELFTERTAVRFGQLTETDIEYYLSLGAPYDKAGGYGIQDWIGLIGVQSIEGSYTNVMGLPTWALHQALMRIVRYATAKEARPC